MRRIVTLSLALSASSSMAFVNRPAFQRTPPQAATQSQQLNMMDHDTAHALTTLAAPVLSSTIAIPSGSLLTTASSALLDPTVESELLADMAHVGLDLSTLLGPATPFLRLAVVLGRLCAIASDYIPDGYMNPEEIVFQSLMLTLGLSGFFQSFLPVVLASTAKTSMRDRRAYKRLFEDIGVTWTQYKAMVAVALDWVQLEPYQVVQKESDDDEYMYWLYGGDAQLHGKKGTQNITSGSGYHALLGEARFAQLLDDKNGTSSKELPKIQAGGSGATFLRINTSQLSKLMEHDKELGESIRSLLVKGMHEKLTSLMH